MISMFLYPLRPADAPYDLSFIMVICLSAFPPAEVVLKFLMAIAEVIG